MYLIYIMFQLLSDVEYLMTFRDIIKIKYMNRCKYHLKD